MSFSAASSRNDDSDLLLVLLVDVKACQGKEHRKEEEKEEKAEVECKDPGYNHIREFCGMVIDLRTLINVSRTIISGRKLILLGDIPLLGS